MAFDATAPEDEEEEVVETAESLLFVCVWKHSIHKLG